MCCVVFCVCCTRKIQVVPQRSDGLSNFPQIFCPLRDSGKMRKRKKGDDQQMIYHSRIQGHVCRKIRLLEGAVVQVIKKSRAKQKRI